MSNFWKELKKPFTVIAPMEDVTDVVFREILTELPRPDVYFTEFTSADGLFSKGHDVSVRRLKYTENQRPIVAQIWGTNPENLRKAAALVQELGFDGVDINMGCPAKKVVRRGAGAALTKNFELAHSIITAVKEGATSIPVSVKTRIGFNKIITEEWISHILSHDIQAISIHGRIAKQMSNGDANWEEIGKAVALRDKLSKDTMIIGNGDVKSYKEVIEKYDKHNVDGVMIGRGVFGNPWIFEKDMNPMKRPLSEGIRMLLRHMRLYDKTWGETKNFDAMKKFFKMYLKDFDGASILRQELMECQSPNEVEGVISKFLTAQGIDIS